MLVEVGSIVEGKVSGITKFGAFIELPEGKKGLVHISEVAKEYVKDINTHLQENQIVKVKVLSIEENGKISLSIKKAIENSMVGVKARPENIDWSRDKREEVSFEDRLARFMKDSDEKMLDLKRSIESKRGIRKYRKG